MSRSSILLLLLAATSFAPAAHAGGPARPALEVRQGHYFRWSAPVGWRSRESTNGVEITSADGSASVQFALLMRSQGQIDPQSFLLMMLGQVPGYRDLRVTSSRRLPDQPSGIPGTVWQVVESELSYSVGGRPVRGVWTCGINAYFGMYDATCSGYHAARSDWPRARQFLPAVARSIAITNPRQVAGNDQLIPARNRPLDNSGLLESWRQKGLSEDRISKARREGTSGYERVKDPSTGHVYEMPLEAWDGTAGGYRDPRDPTRLLERTEPGE